MSDKNEKNHHFTLKREATSDPFVAEIGDATITLTPLADLDQFALAELFGSDDNMTLTEFRVAVFRLAASDETLQELQDLGLNGKEMQSLYEAYMAHGGASEGESAASSD